MLLTKQLVEDKTIIFTKKNMRHIMFLTKELVEDETIIFTRSQTRQEKSTGDN